MDLEVEVRDTRIAGHADVADDLSGEHLRSDRQSGREARQVGIEEVCAVGHRQPPAVPRQRSRSVEVLLRQHAAADCVDVLAGLGDQVDALVDTTSRTRRAICISEGALALDRELGERHDGPGNHR